MALKYLFCLLFLVCQVSCEKNNLVLVIDNTSSMYNDIDEVKKAAKSIVDIVLNEKSSQIEDVVLVTFNDPGVKFRKRTRKLEELKASLDQIRVDGGNDCPELALSGIKQALEESQKGSYIFVFTDASAKDYMMFEEVKTLCQERQSQIVFVLTGDCGYLTSPHYRVYYQLAAASNGQVFRISKGEVGQVLEYVKETIKGDRTVLVSTVVPPKAWHYVLFNIDDKTEYAIVSGAGADVDLSILDQHNKIILRYDVITWTKNAKVFKLNGLSPGAYKVLVYGESEINVMVFGRTDFTFEHGFSNEVKNSLKLTETQPTMGTETHLMIAIKDEENSVNVQHVEILDMNERVIQTLPLHHVKGNVYATSMFLPPHLMFKVAVTATARNTGKPIRRISKTPVEPVRPIEVAPELSHTERNVETIEGSSVDIHCRIRKGKPKPQVSWFFKQQNAINFTLLIDKTDEVLNLNKVELSDIGEYKCLAQNVAGRDEHTIQLDVKALPSFTRKNHVIKIRERENAVIECKVKKANPPPTITWEFKNSVADAFHRIENNGETLRIFNTQLRNSGFYKCQATNEVGTTHQINQLIVLVPPKISKENTSLVTTGGSDVSLTCSLTAGNPAPTVKWHFEQRYKGTSTPFQVTGNRLYIRSAKQEDTGGYTCRAENEAGFDKHTIEVTVEERPVLWPPQSVLRVKENETVYLQCNITRGYPAHTVDWYFKAATAKDYKHFKTQALMVDLHNFQVQDSGDYKCVVENFAGQAEKIIQVVVEVPPKFDGITSAITTQSGSPVTIECKLRKGNPPPSISWQFKPSKADSYVSLKNYGNRLSFSAVQIQQTGEYKCIAENDVGKDEKTTRLTVLDPPDIKINMKPTTTVKENTAVTLTCSAVKGYPNPIISWWYKGSNTSEFVKIANEGNTQLENVQLGSAGHYKCRAVNSVGNAEATTQLIVTAPPRIVFSPPNKPWYNVVEGDVVLKMPCTAVGFPTPSVQWTMDKAVVATDKSQEVYVDDGTLFVKNPSLKYSTDKPHNRTYVCNARNDLGEVNQSYEVHVSRYPDITDRVQMYGVIGQPFDLNCSLPNNGTPVKWFYERPQTSPHPQYRRKRDTTSDTLHTIYQNVTGPTLHFDKPTQADSGNYSCRVSDMNGAASYTVELVFGFPPKTQSLAWDVPWDGEEYEMSCDADQVPSGKFEWYYRGEKIKEGNGYDLSIYLNGWGQYVCRVSNPLGSLNITYNVTTQNCIIDKNLSKTRNMPLILDVSLSWLSISNLQQYLVVPNLDKVTLICQDNTPANNSKVHSGSNGFTKFPNAKSVIATCDHEDIFMVDGAPYSFSELDCKHKVSPSVVETQQKCLGENTTLLNIGFNVDGFLDVYKSCLDTNRNVPLYTEVNMTGSGSFKEETDAKGLCVTKSECCYETVQLVNKADVSFGPAENATFRESLNSVSYCRPNDDSTNWHDIEKQVRKESRVTVWSGAYNYTKVDTILAPQYLWKVVKNLDTEEITAIIHLNVHGPLPTLCKDVCDVSTWFVKEGSRTYCCELNEFKRIFDISIDF